MKVCVWGGGCGGGGGCSGVRADVQAHARVACVCMGMPRMIAVRALFHTCARFHVPVFVCVRMHVYAHACGCARAYASGWGGGL